MIYDKRSKAVTFLIEYKDMDFSQISNFIYKVLGRISLNAEEAGRITYKYYYLYEDWQDLRWVKQILSDRKGYSRIKEPEKIKNIGDDYKINFLIIFREETIKDIVELQSFYLLKKYFENESIWGVFYGDTNFYFKTSQYLSGIYDFYPRFYDHLYYQSDILMRMQKNAITVSRKIMPLQVINRETTRILFGRAGEVLKDNSLEKMIKGEEIRSISWKYRNLIGGTAKLLAESRFMFKEIRDWELYNMFSAVSVLTLVYFAYFIWNAGKKEWGIQEVRHCLRRFEEYVHACQQLAENIVFHSTMGEGCLSLRIYSQVDEYITEKYNIKNVADGCYFEIEISDYAADNQRGNIAENFRKKLEDPRMQKVFQKSVPADFFGKVFHENGDSHKRWKEYYSDSRNIGKHFGLRIFEKTVYQNKGVFIAESHSSHRYQEGDCFSSGRKQKNKVYCMPGTRYSVIFPAEAAWEEITRQEKSLESGEKFAEYAEEFFEYTAFDCGSVFTEEEYFEQSAKETYIQKIAGIMENCCDSTNCPVVYFSAEGMRRQQGEILAKASILAMYRMKKKKHMVFYKCSKFLMDEFKGIVDALFVETGIEAMFSGMDRQIALYGENLEEMVFVLENREFSDKLNQCLGIMKIAPEWGEKWMPFDILNRQMETGSQKSLFEEYTQRVLEEDIQSDNLGCRISHTHMRLGSVIHVNKFYEAEIIFGLRFFISRFAYMIVQDIRKETENIEKLTLYGYAAYSENLLLEVMNLLQKVKPGLDVSFAIFERELKHGEFSQTERIRYDRLFGNPEEQKEYFKDRKVIVVVPVNSTLKTYRRMMDMFLTENELSRDCLWVIQNFALILIGSKEKNIHWNLDANKQYIKNNINPEPKYYIKTEVDYNEALNCKLCFPENPVAEVPLIEVNATSTIPDQSFGLWSIGTAWDKKQIYERIEAEENMLRPLKDCLLYGHISRKESHFLYYFQTEYLFSAEKERIAESLKRWAEKNVEEKSEYNLLVTPLHFSNAGFVELVNQVVFHGECQTVRVDFDKEYRSNMYAKYSNIRSFVNILRKSNQKSVLKIHYVDDNIISGKTFYRAKSLIESVLDVYNVENGNAEVRIFDKIFTLLDRNSEASRMQYIRSWAPQERNRENLQNDYYSYISLCISSLRNHERACVGCNLEKEAKMLCEASSTKEITDYWKERIQKYALHSLPQKTSVKTGNKACYRTPEDRERAYRRMVCTHVSEKILKQTGYFNEKENMVSGVLQLLNSDYENRKESQFEYFLSYLKVLARPFLAFQKSVREAIFDILLLILDSLIKNQPVMQSVNEVKEQKPYLCREELAEEWEFLDDKIIHADERSDVENRDLLVIVMKQLTELKSNYIIRPDSMRLIFRYAFKLSVMQDEKDREEFRKQYIAMIKKLTGTSSDTSKGLWLDQMLRENQNTEGIPKDFLVWMMLENTRVFREGVEKLDSVCSQDRQLMDSLNDYYKVLFLGSEYRVLLKRMEEFQKNKLDNCTESEIEKFLRKNLQSHMVCTEKTVTFLKESNPDMKKIFKHVLKKIRDEEAAITLNSQIDRLKKELKKYMHEYQHDNFYMLLEAYGMAETEENILTDRGTEVIADCLKVYRICEQIEQEKSDDEKEKIVSKIQKLAVLMQNILHAYKLQVIMEKSYSSDWWKEHITEKFNKMIIGENLPDREDLYLKIKCRKDYILLSDGMTDSTAENTINSKVDETVTEYLENFRENQISIKKGYLINEKEGYFIWKIGDMTEHDVFFYAEFDSEKESFELYNDLRNVMIFYNLLQTKVFNTKENSVLHELMAARSELEIYNRDKAHSHTKNDVIQSQYKHAIECEKNEKSLQMYRSGVLTLLADLNVSELYRNSLKPQFYLQKIEYDYEVQWGNQDSVIKSGAEYYVTHGVASDLIKIRFVTDKILTDTDQLIRDTDRVLCGSDSKRQFFLLLFSIALNAAGKERGKLEDNKIEVYFSKTPEGNLRIMNELQYGNLDEERINREIGIEPEREESGISLWAMSRYIKRMLCRILEQKIEKWAIEAKKNGISEELLKAYEEILINALSKKFELKAELVNLNEKDYFSIELPVLWEKYQKELKLRGEC